MISENQNPKAQRWPGQRIFYVLNTETNPFLGSDQFPQLYINTVYQYWYIYIYVSIYRYTARNTWKIYSIHLFTIM
jgi:hypothetical protein